MPLHLLGKKSWNVYNADNIAKVKHDEALAAAREAGEEQRMQEVDSERRMRILRGLPVETRPPSVNGQIGHEREGGHDGVKRERKRRRIAGEDDTERDIRLAQEVAIGKDQVAQTVRPSSDAPLTDRKGNINLFPEEGTSRKGAPKNAEAEAEAAKKKKEFEDQYTMRFSNAAGFKQVVGQKPWYQSVNDGVENGDAAVTKDVWGNEDPRRKEREKTRLNAEDPLAAMQKGVEELREVEKERKRWKEEREREMREIVETDRSRVGRKRSAREERDNDQYQGSGDRNGRKRSRGKRKLNADEDHELESFSLDESATSKFDDAQRQQLGQHHSQSRRHDSEEPPLPRSLRTKNHFPGHHRRHHHHNHHHPHRRHKKGNETQQE